VLGSSGSRKTAALRLLAGVDRAHRGSIEIGGRPVVDEGVFVAPQTRRVGIVFQDYSLFPHLTVARNVAYGVPRTERRRRVRETLALAGLAGKEDRLPAQRSG